MSEYLPEGAQVEILKLLPVESLLRFRSVCKWWKELTNSHFFIQQHLALQKPQFMFESNDPRFLSSFDTLKWPTNPNPNCYDIIGTLHGLVCLYDNDHRIMLWNPSLRKLYTLPRPYEYWDHSEFASLIGETEIDYTAFWIDPCTKVFKVIIFKYQFENDQLIEYGDMYSSIHQGWKQLFLGKARLYQALEHNPCVMIAAVAYWPAYIEFHYWVVLLCFDFEKEVFDTIDAPAYGFKDRRYFNPLICNLRGSLSLLYLDPTHICEIYSRQQGSWVNLFGFSVPSHISRIRVVLDVEEKQENCRFIASTSAHTELVVCDTNLDRYVCMKRGIVNPRYIDFASYFVESILFP